MNPENDPRTKLIEQGWQKIDTIDIKANPRALKPFGEKAQAERRHVEFISTTDDARNGQWEVWMSPSGQVKKGTISYPSAGADPAAATAALMAQESPDMLPFLILEERLDQVAHVIDATVHAVTGERLIFCAFFVPPGGTTQMLSITNAKAGHDALVACLENYLADLKQNRPQPEP